MAGEIVGTLTHHCNTVASVRKNRNGRLYLVCKHCGLLAYGAEGGQGYILDNMTPAEPRPTAPPAPAPVAAVAAPPAAPKPAPAPAATPKKSTSWAPLL